MKTVFSLYFFLLGFLFSSNIVALEISITSPGDWGSVGHASFVKGKVSDPDAHVIVVVRTILKPVFQTQGTVKVGSDGQWRVVVQFGKKDIDSGVEYEIRAFANPRTNQNKGRYDNWPVAEAESNYVDVNRM